MRKGEAPGGGEAFVLLRVGRETSPPAKPAAARPRATPSPIPEFDPVTIAVLPVRLMVIPFLACAATLPPDAAADHAAARKKTDLPREKGPPLRNFGRTHITFGQSDCKSGNFLYLCPVRNPEMFSAISFILEYIATALKSV